MNGETSRLEYVVAWLEQFVLEEGRPCSYTDEISEAKRFSREDASRLARKLEARGCFGVRFGKPSIECQGPRP